MPDPSFIPPNMMPKSSILLHGFLAYKEPATVHIVIPQAIRMSASIKPRLGFIEGKSPFLNILSVISRNCNVSLMRNVVRYVTIGLIQMKESM
jgi:hypothetical protein